MGSVAKRIGQLTARSVESESSQIIRTIQSNKIAFSLSQGLDTTLKDSHDMKVFGLGTLSSMSSKERYARFTHSMYGVYSAMEEELDISSGKTLNTASVNGGSIKGQNSNASTSVAYFWNRHSDILRRSNKLMQDLIDIGRDVDTMEYSAATIRYRNAIRAAGSSDRERDGGGGLLLGHAYTRYLADLMGGQVLATPTRLALGLKCDSPQQYSFDFNYADGNDMNHLTRKEYVEKIYQDLNASGDILTKDIGDRQVGRDTVLEEIVEEARSAFRHNIEVYSEEPIWAASIVGLKNIILGWMFRRQSS